jgi:mersacidin/lichenicidin family type 2 lantibiotic
MSHEAIIRAWGDHDFWSGLTDQERSRVPRNPAGVVDFMDADLAYVVVGMASTTWLTCHTGTVCCD